MTLMTGLAGLATTPASAQPALESAAHTAARSDAAAPVVPTGVDDFTFASMAADYRLGLDAEGHSTLATIETLVARFPRPTRTTASADRSPRTTGENPPACRSTA